MSTTSELGHLAVSIISLPKGKTSWHKQVSNPGPLGPESYALPLRHTGWTTQQNEGKIIIAVEAMDGDAPR